MRMVSLLWSLAVISAAQAQEPAALKPPVDQLAWMIGEWEGPASYLSPEGRKEIHQTERVESVSMGTAIAIRGRGFEMSDSSAPKVVFEAFAVISRARDGSLGFRAWNMEGQYIDPTVVMRQDGLTWSFVDQRGTQIRYTVTHMPDGRWNEVGDWSRDGATWNRFMEMNLVRLRPRRT